MKYLVFLFVFASITGCSSQMAWVRNNTDSEQAQKDFNECKFESTKNSFVPYGTGISPISAGIQEGFQKSTLMNQCMEAKGYFLISKTDLEKKKINRENTINEYKIALANGEHGKALEITNQLINESPNEFGPYQGRGNVYFFMKKYNEAISDYNKAISLGCKEIEVYIFKSQAFLELNEFDIAIESCNQGLKIEENATLLNFRAYAKNKTGNYDSALDDCNKSISLDSNKPNPYKNRGLAYFGKSQYEKAITEFDKAINIDSKFYTAYAGRGDAFLKLGNKKRAIEDYKIACDYGDKQSCSKITKLPSEYDLNP